MEYHLILTNPLLVSPDITKRGKCWTKITVGKYYAFCVVVARLSSITTVWTGSHHRFSAYRNPSLLPCETSNSTTSIRQHESIVSFKQIGQEFVTKTDPVIVVDLCCVLLEIFEKGS